MRLYSTLTRGSKTCRRRRTVRMYFCGPTVYQRAHVGNARPSCSACGCAAGCATAATTRRSCTTSRRQRQDLRRRAGASAELAARATQWYLEDTATSGWAPDALPKATEHMPASSRFIEQLLERGDAYAARATSTSASRAIRLRAAVRPAARPDGPERGAEPAQGGSTRLRALEGQQARRGHLLGLALGPRPSGLAHRVLGDGGGGVRPGVRDPRRRPRPRLPAPREQLAKSNALGTTSRASGRTTGCSISAARRCRSRSATTSRIRNVIDTWGRRSCSLFFMTGTGASRSTSPTRRWQQAKAQVESFRRSSSPPPRRRGVILGRRRRGARRRLQYAGGACALPRLAGAPAGRCCAAARAFRARRSASAQAPPEPAEARRSSPGSARRKDFASPTGSATRSPRPAGTSGTIAGPGLQLVPRA